MTLFKRPVWTDWIFWLGMASVVAALFRTAATDYPLGIGGQEAAFLVDWLVRGVWWFFLFGVVPAFIRRVARR